MPPGPFIFIRISNFNCSVGASYLKEREVTIIIERRQKRQMIRTAPAGVVSLLRRSPQGGAKKCGRPTMLSHIGTRIPITTSNNKDWQTFSTVPMHSSSLRSTIRTLPFSLVGGNIRSNSMYTLAFVGRLGDSRCQRPWTVPKSGDASSLLLPQQRHSSTRRRKKYRKRLEQFKEWKAEQRRRGLKVPYVPPWAYKMSQRPVDFRTYITRLLSKATRGEYTKAFLRAFVRAYPTYSQEQRYTHVIPFLSQHYQEIAFKPFFGRILQEITTKTVEENHGGGGPCGFVWMMQFREELMDLIYQRVEELKTLDRKVKLMRMRLRFLDNMKRQIRKDMGKYLFTLCCEPLPKFHPPKPLAPPTLMDPTVHDGEEQEAASYLPMLLETSSSEEGMIVEEVPAALVTIPIPPSPTDNAPLPLDSEYKNDDDEPTILGCIRRLQYSDLSLPFLKRYARAEPFLAARFRGPNKRVYGWYQDEDSPDPDVIVYVAFLDRIPSTLAEVFVETEPAVSEEAVHLPPPEVAVFYGATILHRSLEKTGIAEYCIRPILRMLREDEQTPSSISTFSTLSPIYSFRSWLLSNDFEDDIALLVVNEASDDFHVLAEQWSCPNTQVFRRMKSLLARSHEAYLEIVKENPAVSTAMDNLLLRCAASYIVKGKTPVINWRCNPLELSTRYHVAHGASVYRLNLASDLTEDGWDESFGMRTNYIYDPKTMHSNQRKFNKSFSAIDFHENVTQYVPRPRKLQLTKEQRERWIPEDPVRKAMIKLSQNGRLFKVPLFGPPSLSRKKPSHPTLVPKRIRGPSPLPPQVPKVGVSGLSITLKTPPIVPEVSRVPSYVSRTSPGGIRLVGEGLRLERNKRLQKEGSNDEAEEVELGDSDESKPFAGKGGKQKAKSRS